jgi:hypothetical protein
MYRNSKQFSLTGRAFFAAFNGFIGCLLLASNVLAQDIDLAQPCNNPSETLYAPLNTALSINIGTTNAPAGNVSWSFTSAPIGFGGVSCSSQPSPIDCNGVIVTLPAPAPGSQTTITGTATSGTGGFAMTLEAAVGADGCTRDYFVDFVEPFQAVLVLDRSGSMGSSSNVTPPATSRWDALETSVNNFSTYFVDAGESSASELGITLFESDIVPNNSFSSTLETITANLPTQIANELSSQSPGGATAMGKGIENALTKFTNPSNPRAIVLFTDGEQNVPPYVDENGLYLNDNAKSGCAAPGPDCTEIPTGINITTIGIGQPSGSYLTTLMNLAAEHNGYSIITSNGEDFTYSSGMPLGDVEAAFTNAIAPVLSSTSPQMVAFNSGQLVGTNPVALPAFELNKNLGGLVIQLSYSKKFEIPDLVTLIAGIRVEKDGTDITPYFSPQFVGNFTNTVRMKTDFSVHDTSAALPDLDSAGSYTVTMVKPQRLRTDLDFKAVTFADDHLLDMQWRVTPKTPKVEQAFNPQMRLSWMGNAVETATVSASVVAPGDDLNHLLATYGKAIDPSSAVDAGTAGYQKYLHLIENDPDFLAKLLPSEQQLTLQHKGDGLYQASYDPGDISGVYQILYDVSYDSADTGAVRRIAMQSIYVRFGDLDTEASQINTSVQGTVTTITMMPISTVGKLIGPGQQNAFRFSGGDIALTSVTDHQDGRYTFVLSGDATQQVTVDLLGTTIYTGSLADFGKPAGPQPGGPKWWWLLLVVIIVLLVLWLIRRS